MNVNIISIFTGSTDEGLKRFKKYFEALTCKEKAVYAKIRYDSLVGTEFYQHPITFPVVIYTTDGFAFCLADVTAGYGGIGPHGTVELLKYLGFDFDKKDILDKNNIVNLNLLKDGFKIKPEFNNFSLTFFDYLDSPFIK